MAVRVRWRPVAAALVAAIAVVATGLVAVPSAHALPNNTITGTVTDGDNDVPAAGLEVRLYREPGRVVVANRTTAADGTYAFAGLDDGSYRLRVADPVSGAFRTEFFADTYAYAQASPVDVAGGATVVRDMTVARPNAVRGTVTDEDTGLPVAGIEVRLYREPGRVVVGNRTTAADGTYQFDQPGPGSYRMRLRDPNGAYVTEHWADVAFYNQAAPIAVAPGQTVTVDPQVGAPTQISGIVTDEATHAPIPGIEARLYREPGRVVVANATTDEAGAYVFTNPGAGTYRVRFSDPVGGRYTTEFWDDAATYPSGDDLVLGAGGSATASAGLARIDATYVVSTAADGADAAIDGVCEATPGAGDCTLRAAVDEANAHPAHDTVQIAAGIDPVLDLPGAEEDDNATGDIDITTAITIEGGGARIDAAGLDRVIDLPGPSSALVLRDVTVTGGYDADQNFESPSALFVCGSARLEGVAVAGNQATGSVITATCGATVELIDSSIIGSGLAGDDTLISLVYADVADLHLQRSVLQADVGWEPWYSVHLDGALVADRSTLVGSIWAQGWTSEASVTLTQSTVVGGAVGIEVDNASVDIRASTVTAFALAIDAAAATSTVVHGSLLTGTQTCWGAVTSLGWNVYTDEGCFAPAEGDMPNAGVALHVLGEHGGPTPTMPLHDNSPGVDAIPVGTPGLCDGGPGTADQRGVPRPVGGACDAGAVEGQSSTTFDAWARWP